MSQSPEDVAAQYNAYLDATEVNSIDDLDEGDSVLKQDGKLVKPIRLPNGLYKFKDNTSVDRVVLDCITSLQNGADLLWIETEKPHVGQIGDMVRAIRETLPNAKLVYINSPSFNWTLNFLQQVFDAWVESGKDTGGFDRAALMSE